MQQEKIGGGRFLQELRGEVSKLFMHFPLSFCNKFPTTVVTRCQILSLKCTKFDFGRGSAPDPAAGAYSAPPGPLAAFKGAYF